MTPVKLRSSRLKVWDTNIPLKGFTIYSFSSADIMGKLSADPLYFCASRINQTYLQSVDKFTVVIAGRRLELTTQAIDFFFTVSQIQSLVMCTIPTVKFKVIRRKVWD